MEHTLALYTLLVGFILVAIILLRSGLERFGVPALVGYFVVGFLLRLADEAWNLLGEEGHQIFDFLGYLGIIVLLFRGRLSPCL